MMENAEEVMQLLEEFSKLKPKDIPRELEDYLGYVAKTGDPVYQWTLIKHLFREKLVTVMTDFYESTLTVELPPCPNVEPFNYERMKSSLLERFDSFCSAPFTVQRICELLTNPRKEYNRADKYMRAIEKNILVVSTREPGSGKRTLECDSQCETMLNGIPEMRGIPEPGSLILIPTDLPYLGAPPISNDVTVETTELNPTINDSLDQDFKSNVDSLEPSDEKSWLSNNTHSVSTEDIQENQCIAHTDISNSDVTANSVEVDDVRSTEDSNIGLDVKNQLSDVILSPKPITANTEGEISTVVFISNCEIVLPDSLDSSEDTEEQEPDRKKRKIDDSATEKEEIKNTSDENEVSSTPENVGSNILVQEEIEDPTDSEAEATDSKLVQDTDSHVLPNSEINSTGSVDTVQTSETEVVPISEITDVKSYEVNLECSEITGPINSPVSPEISDTTQKDNLAIDQNIILEVEPLENPDSSNDLCTEEKETLTELKKPELCVEADSVTGLNSELSEEVNKVVEDIPQSQSNEKADVLSVENSSEVISPDVEDLATGECIQSPIDDSIQEPTSANEVQFPNELSTNSEKITEIPSSSNIVQELCNEDKKKDTTIQPFPNILPDSQCKIEDISVDPNCEVEEEAMDVDDCSNQMMVTEGENEGEPMDQSDQLQS